jgi:hypothetical protein
MAEATREELDEQAIELGLDPDDYRNKDELQAAIDEAAGDDGAGEQGEATEGVQPLTDEDIPESGR